MDPRVFTDEAWGTLTTTPSGNPAFVPHPAPRQIELSVAALGLLDAASNRIGVLEGIGRLLPNPQLLIGPYLRREAVLSSRIEGTQTTLAEVYAAEAEQLSLVQSPDLREVQNYIDAYSYGLARLETLPLSLRLIKELHARLTAGVRGRGREPGEFRRYQNFVGGTSEENATYVGPPVPQMNHLLDDLDRFLNERDMLPLVQMAVAHYQFEAIHPFGDGNGRVGRLLMGVFLAERSLMPQPLLYLSAYFERDREAYYDGLLRVSTHGDWDSWIRYVLEGVRRQADEAADLADALLNLQSRYRERLQSSRATSNALALADTLFANPLATIGRAQRLLGVSYPTARSAVRTLEDAGILRELTGRSWGKIFEASEILELLRADTAS